MTREALPRVSEIEGQSADGWDRGRLAGQLAGACNWQFVATVAGIELIVGYACGMAVAVAGEAELYRLVIHQDHRRRGYGMMLLWEVLGRLAGMRVRRVFLEVRESNLAARALYARCGFRESGRRRGYYASPTEDAIIMERTNEKETMLEEHQGH